MPNQAGGGRLKMRTTGLVHPGILVEEFMRQHGVTQYGLAKAIKVPLPRINAIVNGKRGISADTARRLAKFFGTSAEFWINLQSHFELSTSRRDAPDLEAGIEAKIPHIIPHNK